MKTNLLLLTIGLLQLLACQKKPTLPQETQSGEDTFGVLLDDELWLPGRVPYTASYSIKAFYFPNCGTLGVHADASGSFIFFSADIKGEGSYYINSTFPVTNCFLDTALYNPFSRRYRTRFGNYDHEYFLLDSLKSNLTITKFDTLRKIVSGRFEMKLYDSSHSELNITEGVFDVNYFIHNN